MSPEEIALLTKITVGGSGTAVIFYLALQKLAPLLTNGKKHDSPCGDLKVAQTELKNVKETNTAQWTEIKELGKTLRNVDRTTAKIAGALEVELDTD